MKAGAGAQQAPVHDTAHYRKVFCEAGCTEAVSEQRATCRRLLCNITLLRVIDGKEVIIDEFDTFTVALRAAQDHDIIELSGEPAQGWFSITKPVTIRGSRDHARLLCDNWDVFEPDDEEAFQPYIEIQPSASGLRLGPNLIISSTTDHRHNRQTTAVFVRDGAQDIVFDHVTIKGDAVRKNKTMCDGTDRPGGFGVIFGENTSGEMRHCRVFHHELSGIQTRAGSRVRILDCDVSSNGDTAIWAMGSSEMTVDRCTVRENGMYGVCIDALPSTISNCHIANNYLDGIWLDWPWGTRVAGPDQAAAMRPICYKGHAVTDNHITQNDHGIVVEEGVTVTMKGNVVEGSKEAGVYFDEGKKDTVYPVDLRTCCSVVFKNNVIRGSHKGDLVVDPGRMLPTKILTF